LDISNNTVGLAVDISENILYVTDTGNDAVRKIDLNDGNGKA